MAYSDVATILLYKCLIIRMLTMSYYKEIQNLGFADGGYVLLPQDDEKQYPIVYMFHGIGGCEEWIDPKKGNISALMENVINNGGEQSIVIMPKISGCLRIGEGDDIMKIMVSGSWDQFFNYDIRGLIAYVSSTYAQYIKQGKKNMAIAGFSMGATAATYYAVHNRDMFCSLGAVSFAKYTRNRIKASEFQSDNEDGAIHFIGYGTAEGEDFVSEDYYCIDAFKANNVCVNVEKIEGSGHCFSTFNPLLIDFLKMIFKA